MQIINLCSVVFRFSKKRNNDIKQNFPALEPRFVLILLVNKIRVDLADYDCKAHTHTHLERGQAGDQLIRHNSGNLLKCS